MAEIVAHLSRVHGHRERLRNTEKGRENTIYDESRRRILILIYFSFDLFDIKIFVFFLLPSDVCLHLKND